MILTTCPFKVALFILLPFIGLGQFDFSWFETKWSDSFREWEYFGSWDSSVVVGELTCRWPEQDFSVWDFRFGEYSGEILPMGIKSRESWTLKLFGEQVNIQVRWPGYLDAWRIQYQDASWILATEDRPFAQDWHCEINDTSYVRFFTEVEGDARTWLVEAEGEPLPPMVKLGMSFIAFYVSSGWR